MVVYVVFLYILESRGDKQLGIIGMLTNFQKLFYDVREDPLLSKTMILEKIFKILSLKFTPKCSVL